MKRFAFLAAVAASILPRRLLAQTKVAPGQVKFATSPGPSILVIMADGTHRQVALGTGLLLSEASGVFTLAAASNPPAQRLALEPDKASWRIASPYQNPRITRGGLLMMPGLDYTIEGGNIVRPTPLQGMVESDVWVAS